MTLKGIKAADEDRVEQRDRIHSLLKKRPERHDIWSDEQIKAPFS